MTIPHRPISVIAAVQNGISVENSALESLTTASQGGTDRD
jgi:hypothetical protein